MAIDEPDRAFIEHVPDESKMIDGRNFRRLQRAVACRAEAEAEISEAVAAMLFDGDSLSMISLAMGESRSGPSLNEILAQADGISDRISKGEHSIGAVVSGVDVRRLQAAVQVLLDAGAPPRWIRQLAGLG